MSCSASSASSRTSHDIMEYSFRRDCPISYPNKDVTRVKSPGMRGSESYEVEEKLGLSYLGRFLDA